MELDAQEFTNGTTLDTDVCIVGAGPAGLVLAAELIGLRCDVILLESGAARPEAAILGLNDGDSVGDVYAGLGATRRRGIGGTSGAWNTTVARAPAAKFAPLDAVDFEERPDRPYGGWPFGLAELRGDYERAQRICALGPFSYDAASWSEGGRLPWPATGPNLVSRVYQLGSRDAFVAPLHAAIARAANVRLCVHATALALHPDGSGRRITSMSVGSPGGAPWTVRAKRVVLAAGAVENARMLLLAGNDSSWLGRGFMEHPRDRSLALHPHTTTLLGRSSFYDLRRAADGSWVTGRLALDSAALASGDVLNASATLFPRLRQGARRLRAALPEIVAQWLPNESHGWSRRRSTLRACDGFTLLLNLEQTPHPENRVTLSQRRDALGVPLPCLNWRWRDDDQRRLERLRAIVATELETIGTITVDGKARPDPNAHHHSGTTRMHDNPTHGVTDRNGRVHTMENLYVAGASLFPTAGFANPVLTIVALALRLARHLADAS